MGDQPDNLFLVYLRRLDEKIDALTADMVEVKERLGILGAQYSSLSRRIDRMGGDIERIQRRMDLVDQPSL